jgi:glutamyl/glutaminyl-tRNA synthetase
LATQALKQAGVKVDDYPADYARAALATCKEKIKLFSEAKTFADFYFTETVEYEAGSGEFTVENKTHLRSLREGYAAMPAFDAALAEAALKRVASELKIKPGLLVHPLRIACTGRAVGPSLYHLLEVLGRERVLARIDRAIQ